MPLSLTGSKAVFEKVSIYAADTRTSAPTASELAEQVCDLDVPYPAEEHGDECRCSDVHKCSGHVDTWCDIFNILSPIFSFYL